MVVSRQREIIESPLSLGHDEKIAYPLDITNWGSDPTVITVAVKDSEGEDVSTTHLTGTASVVNPTTILLPFIHSLVAGKLYRLEVKFTIDSNIVECWAALNGEE